MENSFGDRLQGIIKEKMLTGSRFAKEIGVSPQLLNAYLRNERTPSIKVVNLIAVRFPEINTRWLLTGEGDMLNIIQPNMFPEMEVITDESDKDSSIVSRLLGIVEKQAETIDSLSESIREIKWMLEKKINGE